MYAMQLPTIVRINNPIALTSDEPSLLTYVHSYTEVWRHILNPDVPCSITDAVLKLSPFICPISRPKYPPGDPILFPVSIFCYSP